MMVGFSDDLDHYLVPSEQAIGDIFANGLVVVDSNVLLDMYRFTSTAGDELYRSLEKVGDRLWIPHQVRLEFHRNRVMVMAGREEAYQEVIRSITDFQAAQDQVLQKVRELANRVLLSESDRDNLLGLLSVGLERTKDRIMELRADHGIADSFADDSVLRRLQVLFQDRTGVPLDADELEKVQAEGIRRVNAGEPPGYKDKDKGDPTGDYLVWYQILKEAASRRSPVVFVTRDAKDDWFLRVKGHTVSARPELLKEAKDVAGVAVVFMQTQSFLFNARRYLNSEVSEETLKEAALAETPAVPDKPTIYITDRLVKAKYYLVASQESIRRDLAKIGRRVASLEDEAAAATAQGLDTSEIESSIVDTNAQMVFLLDQRNKLDDIKRVLDSEHSNLGSHVRIMWTPPPSSATMVRFFDMARAWLPEEGSDPTDDVTLGDDYTSAVMISDGSAALIGERVRHKGMGKGRIASTRRVETEVGSFGQVLLYLDDGGKCWVPSQDVVPMN
jgi:rRNA-processing protein FCF1